MTLREVFQAIDADLLRVAHYSADFSGNNVHWARKLSMLLTPTLMCTTGYRFAHWLYANGHKRLALAVTYLNFLVHKAIISPGARVGPGFYIPHTVGVILHGHAGANLTLYAHAVVCSSTPIIRKIDVTDECPILGDDVTVGAHSMVVGPVSIGSGTTVGLGVGVTMDVPPRSVVMPGPSRIARETEKGTFRA